MLAHWRLGIFNGGLLACYFIPVWTAAALHIVMSPVRGFFARDNVAVAMFISDYLQFSAPTTVRIAWMLALGKLTAVAFFAAFAVLVLRAAVRKSRGCDEALAIALGLGTLISFISMLFAVRVGEAAALQLHATETLLLLGGVILMLIDQPAAANVSDGRRQRGRTAIYPFSNPSSRTISVASLTAWLAAGTPQ